MVTLILSEARTGSLNLMLWLKQVMKDHIVLFEPYNPMSFDFINKKYDWIDIIALDNSLYIMQLLYLNL